MFVGSLGGSRQEIGQRQRHGVGLLAGVSSTEARARHSAHVGFGQKPVEVGTERRSIRTTSPFASDTEVEHFRNEHRDRCGREVQPTGFYADVIADSLTLKDCESPDEAYGLAEALRIGASRILDMDREDLEVLVIRQPGTQFSDASLYDPMPGGSGSPDRIASGRSRTSRDSASIWTA